MLLRIRPSSSLEINHFWKSKQRLDPLLGQLYNKNASQSPPQYQNGFESLNSTSTENVKPCTTESRKRVPAAGPKCLWESVTAPTPLTPSPRQTAHFCQKAPPVAFRDAPYRGRTHRRRHADVPRADMGLEIHVLTTLGEFYLPLSERVRAWICQNLMTPRRQRPSLRFNGEPFRQIPTQTLLFHSK